TSPGGWSRDVYTLTPGIPGDSGSGFLNASGGAIGVLSTVQSAPLAGSNGVGDLGRELAHMHANTSFGQVNLVNGTEPFSGSLTGAVLAHAHLSGASSLAPKHKLSARRCRTARKHGRKVRRCR